MHRPYVSHHPTAQSLEELYVDTKIGGHKEDLELNTHNTQEVIGGPMKVKIMLLMLQNKLDIGSKGVYPNSMEATVYFQQDTVK